MKFALTFSAAAVLLSACAGNMPGSANPGAARATAQLQSTTGNTTSGTVNFVQGMGKVVVSGEVRGLTPNAEHGFHVHEKGDCSSRDGESAGGHFNPDGKPHGSITAMAHHAGDLQSLKADASGVAKFSFDAPDLSVGSGIANIVGKGLIVHKNPDDYTTQPSGNAGPRLACAVIARG